MNYEESKQIKEVIDTSNNIIINCHRGVDLDSIASALAFKKLLNSMGKKVDIYCPEKIADSLRFLPGSEEIEQGDFSKIDYSQYDSFFMLDSESWDRVGLSSYPGPANVINIDHHPQNKVKGSVNLIDNSAFAC
ncbi:hypothetical protein HY045_00795 [Candidatus Woesebacteria bacterium]|nr:hypothetical protein [Candidatus Woesebacteria bacterium]